jgi:hypothetical protein
VHEPTDGVGWNDATAGMAVDPTSPPPVVLPGEVTVTATIGTDAVTEGPDATDVPDVRRSQPQPDIRLKAVGVPHAITQPTETVPSIEDDATAPKIGAIPLAIALDDERQDMTTMEGLRPVSRRSPMLFIVMGGLLPLAVALLAGVFIVIQDVGGVRGKLSALFGASPEVPVSPAPAPAASEIANAMADGGSIRFVSQWGDTAKLKVRCGEVSARGEKSVEVAADSAARCDVTAMRADRSRKLAVVKGAKIGTYTCFADGKPECKRQ